MVYVTACKQAVPSIERTGRDERDHGIRSDRRQVGSTGQHEDATTLPHSIEAEQQLLGAILTNNDVYDRVAAIIAAKHFYDPVHARIFEIAAARIAKNNLASPVTLKAFMEDDEGLKELGGPAYLVRLAGAAMSSFAVRDYAQMIYDLAIRRDLIALGRDISAKAAKVDVDSEPREQIVEAEQQLYKLAEQGRPEAASQSFLRAVTDAVNVANAAYQREGGLRASRPASWTWTRSSAACTRPTF